MNFITIYLYASVVIILALFGFLLYFFWYLEKIKKYDMIIIFDEFMRWRLVLKNLKDQNKVYLGKNVYEINQKCSYLDKKGRSLNIFFHNKTNPLYIGPNGTEWLTADSISAIMNNDIIQGIVKPPENILDRYFWLIVFIGVFLTIAVSVIAMKIFNVI